MRSFLTIAALCNIASAHFLLRYPPTIGFDDDKEGTGPCGSFTPDLTSTATDFHIGGDAVAVTLTHPQGKWLFRVTTDPTDDKSWEQIYPIVLQSGLGNFCLPQLTVPSKFEGKKGVLSIVSSAVDGLLYQCSIVNFVSGSQKPPSVCTNATLTASFDSDAQLSALVGSDASSPSSGSASSSSSSPTSSSPTSASATATPSATATKKNAAGVVRAESGVIVLAMAVVGGLLMI